MNTSEHLAQALHHLEQAAEANHDHLLLEARNSEWHERVVESALASAARAVITSQRQVSAPQPEAWLLSEWDRSGRPRL